MIILHSNRNEEIYQNIYREAHQSSYVAYLRGRRCKDEVSFFQEVSASFQFPWYFGETWASFDECICDLEWLQFERIFLVIDDFSKMFNSNSILQDKLIKYLSIMDSYWEQNSVSIEIWLNN